MEVSIERKVQSETQTRHERQRKSTYTGYDRADQYPPNGQEPKTRLHDLPGLQDEPTLRALLRDALLRRLLLLPRRGADEPAGRLDVREGDHAERDGQRHGRVGMRERGEREERFRVERGWRLRQSGEEHGRAHEHGQLRQRRNEHRQPGPAAVPGVKLVASHDHLVPRRKNWYKCEDFGGNRVVDTTYSFF